MIKLSVNLILGNNLVFNPFILQFCHFDPFYSLLNVFCSLPIEKIKMPLRELTHTSVKFV